MKKNFTLLLMLPLLFLTASLSAQIGVKGGINFFNLSQENTAPNAEEFITTAGIGAVAGITFDLNISDAFSIQPEVLFIQKGGKDEARFLGTRVEQVTTLNFVEVPVMAKLIFGNSGNDGGLGLYITGGPWAGFALNGKLKSTTFGNDGSKEDSETITFSFDDEDNRNRMDWGLAAGAGLVIGNLIIEGRYNHGIRNLYENDSKLTADRTLQTRGVSVTIGMVF